MSRSIPVTSGTPKQKPITLPDSKKPTKWTFSFIDFGQQEYFGLNKSSNNWFVAMLEQLKKVGGIDIERLSKDTIIRTDLRYHPINWAAEGVKFNRKDFDWIDKDVLGNEDEFPFYQFQISTGMGRIVGYWYETIFHIIAFDPLHNLQPSKKHNYQIRPCSPVESDLTTLLYALDKVKRQTCEKGCMVKKELDKLNDPLKDTNAILLFLDDEFHEQFNKITMGKSISELVEEFLVSKI
ncbi:MAG: hypothetical protein EOO46_00160 [Flavobacterium sp.]|nr:MAG: hypothetical protein EOO46_00160 [Flavobacterium sp.]